MSEEIRIANDGERQRVKYESGIEKEYEGITEMLLGIESELEKRGKPGRSTAERRFKAGRSKEEERGRAMSGEKELKGKKATFVVQIQYRQNATWQGKIKWVEKNEEQAFRSALEMIKLIDNAAEETGI